jgi:hypothetical protein
MQVIERVPGTPTADGTTIVTYPPIGIGFKVRSEN